MVGVEQPAADECLDPRDEVIGGRDDAAGRRGIRRVLASVVAGLECPGSGRGLDVGRIQLVYQGKGGAAVQVAVRVGLGESVRGPGGESSVFLARWPD